MQLSKLSFTSTFMFSKSKKSGWILENEFNMEDADEDTKFDDIKDNIDIKLQNVNIKLEDSSSNKQELVVFDSNTVIKSKDTCHHSYQHLLNSCHVETVYCDRQTINCLHSLNKLNKLKYSFMSSKYILCYIACMWH